MVSGADDEAISRRLFSLGKLVGTQTQMLIVPTLVTKGAYLTLLHRTTHHRTSILRHRSGGHAYSATLPAPATKGVMSRSHPQSDRAGENFLIRIFGAWTRCTRTVSLSRLSICRCSMYDCTFAVRMLQYNAVSTW